MAAIQPLDLSEARRAMLDRPKTGALHNPSFHGASRSRLNVDWAVRMLSADQEIRGSLLALRARCRVLANNNDYAGRFLNKARENVVGSNGIALEMALDPDLVPGADKINRAIEDAWERWCSKPEVSGRMTFVDAMQLWLASKLQDGEVFVRSIKGYPYNEFRYAVQFIDPDMIDVNYQRRQQVNAQDVVTNDIRMGVEIDEWHRPLFYYMFAGHPAEMAATRRLKIPAQEVFHGFVFKRINQTRGVPWMHTAMTRMNMLGGMEEAELVASRMAATKMGFFTSKTGDDYAGGFRKKGDGAIEIDVEPASMEELPEGVDFKTVDWNHPNQAFPEFVRAMLRGAAMGLNASYSTISGDLRDVNFSSLRQGMLDEREGWKVLQIFTRDHGYKPVFADWLQMAITSGQLDIPAKLPLDVILRAAKWTPRGWDWVDPMKDVSADTGAVRAGMSTLAEVAAKRGRDWRKNIDQRAIEIAYAKEKGVPIDLTTSGSGGVEGDQQNEGAPAGAQQ